MSRLEEIPENFLFSIGEEKHIYAKLSGGRIILINKKWPYIIPVEVTEELKVNNFIPRLHLTAFIEYLQDLNNAGEDKEKIKFANENFDKQYDNYTKSY